MRVMTQIEEMDSVRFVEACVGSTPLEGEDYDIYPGMEGIVIDKLDDNGYRVEIGDPDTLLPKAFVEVHKDSIQLIEEDE